MENKEVLKAIAGMVEQAQATFKPFQKMVPGDYLSASEYNRLCDHVELHQEALLQIIQVMAKMICDA